MRRLDAIVPIVFEILHQQLPSGEQQATFVGIVFGSGWDKSEYTGWSAISRGLVPYSSMPDVRFM